MKKFLIPLLLLLIPAASAENVLYILTNVNNYDHSFVDFMVRQGLDVQRIDNEDLDGVDWEDYSFMIIGEGVMRNADKIPVNSVPSLIMNTRELDDWHWATKPSVKVSSQPLTAYANPHMITQGYTGMHAIYRTNDPSVYYLHRYYRSLELSPALSTSNATVWDTMNGIVMTAIPGTKLLDNVVAKEKGVFFGITQTDDWTPFTYDIFNRTIEWLLTDFIPPAYSEVTVDPLTNSSATIAWTTDKPSTTKLNIDGRQFTLSGYRTLHTFNVNNLDEDTTYEMTFEGCNENGYCSTSAKHFFTTLDFTPPQIISIGTTGLTNQSANITVEIDESGYAFLLYGETVPDKQTPISQVGTMFTFTLQLKEDTSYAYKAWVCDDSDNCVYSEQKILKTEDYTAPVKPQNVKITYQGITWDDAEDDARYYDIYASSTPEGFTFTTPIATVETTDFQYEDNLPERYYIIRARDDAGNQEDNSEIYGKFSITLKPGYNLVSLPLMPQDQAIGSVIYGHVKEVIGFDAAAQVLETQTLGAGGWNPSKFQTLEPGKGYFFFSEDEGTFVFTGTLPGSSGIILQEGMNLVGSTTLSAFPEGAIEAARRMQDGRYQLATLHPDGWHDEFNMEPGIGYWIKKGGSQ